MNIKVHLDCDNSPKRKLVKQLTIDFVSYKLEQVKPFLDENVSWTLVGEPAVNGREQFLTELNQMKDNRAISLEIHQILTHGKSAAVSGEMTMQDGSVYGFADIYEFTSAASKIVRRITSYVVPIKQ